MIKRNDPRRYRDGKRIVPTFSEAQEMIGDLIAGDIEADERIDLADAADAMRGTVCADCGCEIFSVNGFRTECPCEAVASWAMLSEGYH